VIRRAILDCSWPKEKVSVVSQIINILDAKSALSKLVHELETGGAREFIIARNGRPAARLVPIQAQESDRGRRIGVANGRFTVPDDIDKSGPIVTDLFQARRS
jgi:antitoxin (DNA-binding transcriptional repressor) of toxin-antitoxin stability system